MLKGDAAEVTEEGPGEGEDHRSRGGGGPADWYAHKPSRRYPGAHATGKKGIARMTTRTEEKKKEEGLVKLQEGKTSSCSLHDDSLKGSIP